MRRSKADVDRYISSVQSASPSLKEKPIKGFLFAKLYFKAKEYELAKRYVSAYLTVHERDPKAHKFLGQLYEREGDIGKAVGCYKRSVNLNPTQNDLVLKVAELLCSKPELDNSAEFWVEMAARLFPGSPAVYNLKEKLLSSQGQQGWNQLFDLLQSELQLRPGNAHINVKLVHLYCSDGRLEEAVGHCLAVEKKGALRGSLDWYSTLVRTLQEYLAQPSTLSNEKKWRKLQKELLLAHCSLLRLSLSEQSVQQCVEALQSFDYVMQTTAKLTTSAADELSEAFTEMRGHLYLHAGSLLLKMAHVKEQQWRAVTDLAALCYLLAYQVPKPKSRPSKGAQATQQLVESLACDRQSQAGHMLLNLSQENDGFVKQLVEAFGNRKGQGNLFEMLFGAQAAAGPSLIGNDDFRSMGTDMPGIGDLAKWDSGAIVLYGGDLQQLAWLGLQWALMGQTPALRAWLKQLFPRLTLETSKLDTNTPESISLLDLEVFLSGVVFCSQAQLQETQKITTSSQLHEVRCLPLQVIKLLSNERQRDWWNAVYSLFHNKSPPGMSAKLRITVQHGLSTLRAGEKHGLQPALAIHWAQHLSETGSGVNSYYDQKEYFGRSVHYWKVVLTLLEKIKKRRSIPEPLDPLFMHFRSKDIQISEVKSYEEEAEIAFAIFLDIEGRTEEAIAALENINSISSCWHLAQTFQRLSEEAGNGVEENPDRCITFLLKFRKFLSKIHNANAAEIDKLPISMEEVMDMLNDVNQQLAACGEDMDEEEDGPPTSPSQLAEPGASASRIKFSTPSPTKSVLSPSKRHIFSPETPPHWAEDQKSILKMLCQQVEALTNEVHDLRHNSSGATASPHHRMYGEEFAAEGLQEPFPAAQNFHGGRCVSCQTPNPSSNSIVDPAVNKPSAVSFGAGFGSQFAKKEGQWDCNTCAVRNEASASHCVSCQTPNPSRKSIVDPAVNKPSTVSFGAGFGSQFAKKEGQWDCDTCLVRNDASAAKCVSCQSPRKIQMPSQGELAAMFGKKEGQWDCDTCLVSNDGSSSACLSCQTPNPNAKVANTSTKNAAPSSSSAFSFSFGSQNASNAPAATGFKANFNAGTTFKFGQGEDKSSQASFKFELPPSQVEIKPSTSGGFSFSMPMPTGAFKFGTQEPVKLTAPAESQPDEGSASLFLKNIAEQHREKEKNAAEDAGPSVAELTPVSPRECTPLKMTCGQAAVAVLEETTKERTDLPPQSCHAMDSSTSPAAAHSPQNPSKAIVSPSKFVFGTDSLQKIFGSPPSSHELMPSSKTSSKEKAPSVPSAGSKSPESAPASQPSIVTPTPAMPTFKAPTRAASEVVGEKADDTAKLEGAAEQVDSEDLQVVFVREPTAEQEQLARELQLPPTFFCYQNEPGYFSDDSQDDEDFETAVRKLNGKLYPDPPEEETGGLETVTQETGSPETVTQETGAPETVSQEVVTPEPGTLETVTQETGTLETVTQEAEGHEAAPAAPPAGERDAECVLVWEKKPTPEEEERAVRLQLPPTFFCGAGSDEGERDEPRDFETEKRKVREDMKMRTEKSEVADPIVSSSSDAPAAEEQVTPHPDSSSEATPVTTSVAQDSAPIDLSTKKGPEPEPDSTSQDPPVFFGFTGCSDVKEFSFADLAKSGSDFAFGKQDASFSWANAGATVFGAAPVTRNEGDEEGSDDEEAVGCTDIHFEPIVSLPEVETKSGEEDEEILFKERTRLYRWDRTLNQWKERGVGDIKILYHPQKRFYRVLMRRDQVFKVCANHTITQGMELMPMNTSNNALVWTATDYAEGSAQVEQLAAKFKTEELAGCFRRKFEECLSRMAQSDFSQLSRVLEHSREGNPIVFFCVAADGEPLGKITMELFSHIVPKTAENFRALCTGERGLCFRRSIFHRIIPDFMCQGGDIIKQDGSGGTSIFGDKFEDENFDVKHTGPGLLSMANRGRDTNNSQFFITLKKAEHLDFKHVAFGFVKDGMDVVKLMGELGTKNGQPSKKIVVTDCGQLQ